VEENAMSTPDAHRRNLENSGNGEMRKPVNMLPGEGLPSLETVRAPKACAGYFDHPFSNKPIFAYFCHKAIK
jgi:hypothetical protein